MSKYALPSISCMFVSISLFLLAGFIKGFLLPVLLFLLIPSLPFSIGNEMISAAKSNSQQVKLLPAGGANQQKTGTFLGPPTPRCHCPRDI